MRSVSSDESASIPPTVDRGKVTVTGSSTVIIIIPVSYFFSETAYSLSRVITYSVPFANTGVL